MSDDFDQPLEARLRKRWRETLRPWTPSGQSYQRVAIKYDDSGEPIELPDPEDFAPTPKVLPSGFELMPAPGAAWVGNLMLVGMIAACIINWTWRESSIAPMVASGEAVFQRKEYWRLVTALFGHGDVMHILHNAPIFWFFAWILNAYFGLFVSGVLVLLVGIISNLFTLLSYEPRMQLLGASGMVYGMVAMWLVLYIRFDRKGWWVKRVMRSLGFSLLVLFPQTYEANVSYMAHASGFLTGLILAGLWMPFAMKYAPVKHDPYYQWIDYDKKD